MVDPIVCSLLLLIPIIVFVARGLYLARRCAAEVVERVTN